MPTKATLSPSSRCTDSNAGISLTHGAHHDAKTLTTTGLPFSAAKLDEPPPSRANVFAGAASGRHHHDRHPVDDDALGGTVLRGPNTPALLGDDLAAHQQLATPDAPRLPALGGAGEAEGLHLARAADELRPGDVVEILGE